MLAHIFKAFNESEMRKWVKWGGVNLFKKRNHEWKCRWSIYRLNFYFLIVESKKLLFLVFYLESNI